MRAPGHICKTKLMAFVFDGDLRASVTAVLRNARRRRACYNATTGACYYLLLWETISLTIYLNSTYHFVLISIYI